MPSQRRRYRRIAQRVFCKKQEDQWLSQINARNATHRLLRGAAVDPEFRLDLRQRHALIAGGGQFCEAQEVGGFLEGHRRPRAHVTDFVTLIPHIGDVGDSLMASIP